MHLTCYFAAMNAGKSTQLLQLEYNFRERGLNAVIYTAAVDDRSGVGKVASRLGIQRNAHVFDVNTTFDLESIPANTHCLLVDEAQFLGTRQIEDLHQLAHTHGVQVICWCLRSDFQGKAFNGSATLLILADEMYELKAVCSCGKKATMNARIDEHGNRVHAGPQLLIGGNDRYVALCPRCFYTNTGQQPRAVDAGSLL